ncbi:uncharacterized protein LOC108087026 [Drosophila ficusphila]|uniref:uncharacterized protein LOC108087026 n=1 Tax=Drosophila ficusphila TaxID=30025 RepID=UPI0007E6D95B|nr:uncharacterized protein LOC108087026 [Drosophila ficusphila]
MSRNYCGYNPPPPNFKTFFPDEYKDRLQRLPNFGKMRRSWEVHKRPTLIMLHVFADDFGALRKWMHMAYQLAAPEDLGQHMDFYADDLWQSYIFNEEDFTFFRSDEGCTVESAPLIYAVNAKGKVFFFGDFSGPKSPDLESLRDFCEQLIKGKLEEPKTRETKVEDINLANWNEIIYSSDEDIALCFYNSLQNGTDINKNLMTNLERLADKLKQESVHLYKMDLNGVDAPKKFAVESTPAFFVLQGAQKYNPLRCKYELGTLTMLRFVAENTTEELNYYNRRGHRKLHAELLVHIKDYFDLNKKNHGFFL